MSFSFNAAGTPSAVIAEVGKQAANLDQVPNAFADSINDQLSRLPGDAEVTLICYGHTGRSEGQSSGEISLHATISYRVTQPAAKVERVVDPEAQPGPERFPEGFTADAPPGPSASDTDAS